MYDYGTNESDASESYVTHNCNMILRQIRKFFRWLILL